MVLDELDKAKIVIGNLSIELQVTKETLELYKKWHKEEEKKVKHLDSLLKNALERLEYLEIENLELEKSVNLPKTNGKK